MKVAHATTRSEAAVTMPNVPQEDGKREYGKGTGKMMKCDGRHRARTMSQVGVAAASSCRHHQGFIELFFLSLKLLHSSSHL